MGGRVVKEEDPKEDIEEVKAETEEEVVEDVEGGGVLVVTPWLRGEASHAWGLSHANQRNVLTLPWVQAALDSGYSPDALLFTSANMAYVTLCWAFHHFLRHRIRNKGVAVQRGSMDMETPAGKSPVPHPRTDWCRGLDAS